MSFKKVYNFRPGFMKLCTKASKECTADVQVFCVDAYPLLKALAPNSASTLKQVGKAMINCLIIGSDKQVLEVKDINKLGNS